MGCFFLQARQHGMMTLMNPIKVANGQYTPR